MGSSDITKIERKEAASKKVSYGEPIILHESSKSRLAFIPFFIPSL